MRLSLYSSTVDSGDAHGLVYIVLKRIWRGHWGLGHVDCTALLFPGDEAAELRNMVHSMEDTSKRNENHAIQYPLKRPQEQ
jgi:hypothetical protein